MLTELRNAYHILPAHNASVQKWQAAGKKVVGFVCSTIPEELFHAASIFPLRVIGNQDEIVEAHSCCANFACHVMKSILQLGLQGQFQNLDGMVLSYGCEGGLVTMQPLMENVKFPFVEYLQLPHTRRASAFHFFKQELARLKTSIENFAGKQITDEDLRNTIAIYHQNRSLLRQLHRLKNQRQPLLSSREFAEIVLAGMFMPKEEHTALLQKILTSLPQRQDLPPANSTRIHLAGTLLPADFSLYELVEELGGTVVSDDLCIGTRYYWQQIDTSLEPLDALADYYFYQRLHCPFVFEQDTWDATLKYIQTMIDNYQAQGVLFCTPKWCDAFNFQRRYLELEFEKIGLPTLSTETERTVGIAQLRTRLEAFFEILGVK
jgi:benzoyl-CoA reductase subunit C